MWPEGVSKGVRMVCLPNEFILVSLSPANLKSSEWLLPWLVESPAPEGKV